MHVTIAIHNGYLILWINLYYVFLKYYNNIDGDYSRFVFIK